MSLEDTLHLGPINLPVRYLVFIASAAAGLLVMSLVLLRRGELRRSSANRVLNAIVVFVVVWKLEPLVAALVAGVIRGPIDLSTVFLQLFVPGGRLAAALGAGAALVYLLVAILRAGPPRGRQTAAIAAALLPAALFYLAAELALKPNHAQLEQAATPAGAATLRVGTSVGDRAPLFEAASLGGMRYRLSGARGKTIVLNFWASWCPPCRAELPDLVRFAAAHRASQTAVWGLNMTTSEPSVEAVRTFSRQHRIDFPVLLDQQGSIARAYRVTALPTTFVISPEGVILAKQVGAMSPSWLRGALQGIRR